MGINYLEYYLNRNRSGCSSGSLDTSKFLKIENYLSEFTGDREKVLTNLGIYTLLNDLSAAIELIRTDLDLKQDVLIDGETLKTINGESLLGEGNIEVDNKNIIITQEDYDALDSYVKNAIYFVVSELPSDDWTLGDNLPIILGGDSWSLGDNLPIILL